MLKLRDTLTLPSGRIFICETQDLKGAPYIVECTEMQDVLAKDNPAVAISDDPEIIRQNLLSYEEKWLLTVSTQLGCGYECKFCDVPLLPFRGNIDVSQIIEQIYLIVQQSPQVKRTSKAKIGFARMGEPALNWPNVLEAMRFLYNNPWPHLTFLPCYNSIVPNTIIHGLKPFDILEKVLILKEDVFKGFLHIQLSINSTDEVQRHWLFNGAKVISLNQLIDFFDRQNITNRTITLNFICAEGWEIDPNKLRGIDPNKFTIKLIPLNKTRQGDTNKLKPFANYRNFELLQQKGEIIRALGLNVVVDTIAKCEEAGLCCGQLAHIHMAKYGWNVESN